MTPPLPAVGDRLTCVQAGTTLLRDGATYTVLDVLEDLQVIELRELRGFLFGMRRFLAA